MEKYIFYDFKSLSANKKDHISRCNPSKSFKKLTIKHGYLFCYPYNFFNF